MQHAVADAAEASIIDPIDPGATQPYDVEETVDLTVELHPTIQVPSVPPTGASNPRTPVPAGLYGPALELVYRQIASCRDLTGDGPVVIVLNPITALEVILTTHDWDAVQDPASGRAIPLLTRPGIRPDEVVCIEAPGVTASVLVE